MQLATVARSQILWYWTKQWQAPMAIYVLCSSGKVSLMPILLMSLAMGCQTTGNHCLKTEDRFGWMSIQH